jgi:hypothetical protein
LHGIPPIAAIFAVLAPMSGGADAHGHMHSGIPWCGIWLMGHTGIHGPGNLAMAREWARIGQAASPAPGVIVVWPHHVGIITGHSGNQWVVESGNDGGRVRNRPRSIAGAIAFRRPA